MKKNRADLPSEYIYLLAESVITKLTRSTGNRKYLTTMRHLRGVTLVELMVVVAVAAVLAMAAIPSMQTFTLNRQADRLTQELQLDLMYARNQAITQAQAVTVFPQSDGWHSGWRISQNSQIIREKGSNSSPIADSGVVTSTFTSAAPLTFDNQGRVVSNGTTTIGTFTIDVPDCTGNRKRTITINFIGQIVTVESPCT